MHEKASIIIYQDTGDNNRELLEDCVAAIHTKSLQVLVTRTLKTKQLKPFIYTGNFPKTRIYVELANSFNLE